MSAALYLVYATAVPDFEDGSEHVLIDRDLDAGSGVPIDPSGLEFISTAVADREHSDTVVAAISHWFTELGASGVQLELIATDPIEMSPNQRARYDALEPGAWSVNASFVAFCRGSAAARDEARALVVSSALLGQ